MKNAPVLAILLVLVFSVSKIKGQDFNPPRNYEDLTVLFKAWRQFENPPLLKGAPDYTRATREQRQPAFEALQNKLMQLDTTGWQIAQKADWMVVWAEMNGYDFNQRVLKPWERDPAFYKSVWTERSDVPAHEGPTHHRTTELWTYTFPLPADQRQRLLADLQVIPALNAQARENLSGNARELWLAGIRDIRQQSADLEELRERPGVAADLPLAAAIGDARGH